MGGELLSEPRSFSSPEISIAVSAEDAKTIMWAKHKWTRRLVMGGGSLLVSAVLAAAGLWASATLDAQRGMRTDMAAIRADMSGLSKELGALVIADKARELEHKDYERRIQRLEKREELLERYDRALTNYEERHGLEGQINRATNQAR